MYEDIEYFVYMKDGSRVAGVLSNSRIEQLDEHLLYFSMAIFDGVNDQFYGIPLFFDIIFTCKDDDEVIIREYKDCYVVECTQIMLGNDMQIMRDVKIHFEERNILEINRNI
jgi:hypothetical protein